MAQVGLESKNLLIGMNVENITLLEFSFDYRANNGRNSVMITVPILELWLFCTTSNTYSRFFYA